MPVRDRRLLVCPCRGQGEARSFAAPDLGEDAVAPELASVTARYAALVPFGTVATLLSEPLPVGGAQNADTSILGIRRRRAATMSFGATFIFGAGRDSSVLLRNFHPPEDGFCWSAGRWAEVRFPLAPPLPGPPPTHALLALELAVFRAPPALAGQDLLVYLNGWRVASLFVDARQVLRLPVRWRCLEPDGDNVLTLDVPDAAHPSHFGLGDGRRLGVQLFSLRVEAADARGLPPPAGGGNWVGAPGLPGDAALRPRPAIPSQTRNKHP